MENTTQITEGNKLIAEFMNWYTNDSKTVYYDELGDGWDVGNLPFNISWDFLMTVIEKCRESQIFGSQRLIDNIDKRLLKLDLLSTYKNVVDFIEFYKNA